MRTLEYIIEKENAGLSVKAFLRNRLMLSAKSVLKLKHADVGMKLNGVLCRTYAILKEGDKLELFIEEDMAEYEAVPLDIEIVYEDLDFLIVNKPVNMPVHPSPGHDKDSLLNAVAYHYQQTGQTHFIRPIYRLDKDTRGLVVIGKNRIAVSSTEITKTYYAVVEGVMEGSGRIDKPIELVEGHGILRRVGGDLNAITNYEALKTDGSHTLLKINLQTGRTHQIRVHFMDMGHPLAGDDFYGGKTDLISGQALLCKDVSIKNIALGIYKEIALPFPKEFVKAFPKILE